MNNKNLKRRTGQCGYCYKVEKILYGVNLRANVKDGWQELIFICPNCKDHLRGHFRYDRSNSQKHL